MLFYQDKSKRLFVYYLGRLIHPDGSLSKFNHTDYQTADPDTSDESSMSSEQFRTVSQEIQSQKRQKKRKENPST